ncbi:ubiquitin-like small modifier protein 2 [Halolamina sp.]|jgi:sulfur carrier protein|uniref:ubiquitin-like small modifier protein SAMP2 n=1 Tax=Halolamina sp. TaxID=1940283 RepID=UPI000223BB5A|nr:thiamineS protein [halophilic archaeon DL31]
MEVTARVVGESEERLTLPDDADYAALVRELGYSPHEVTVLVDETPVPEDAPVEADRVKVLRLVAGG